MSFHKIELFGHVTYGPELSYHDLLTREDELKAQVQTALDALGGEFLHFEAMGDALRFQCLLAEEREKIFHAVCDALAPHVLHGLDARILVVDKDLNSLYYYSISGGKWQESLIGLPPAGYLAPAQAVKVGKQTMTDHPKTKKR